MANQSVKSPLDEVLVPGYKLAGKYLVVSKLGVGNFAYVIRGKHEAMDRDVALKLLKPEMVAANPDVSERFLTEVRIVSRLRSPNTVTIYDFGETSGGLLYMVLEFVDGVTLEQVLKRGAFEHARGLKVCLQILKSLDEAHTQDVVHRDLKPGNIMLTNTHGIQDFVKVLDFGVAKMVAQEDAGEEEKEANKRRSTRFIGTPIYMSPEQVLGRRVTPASDLYSLGLILYELLTGRSPINPTMTVAAVAQLHIDPEPLPFDGFDQIPAYLQRVIRKATERDPQKRYQTAREFAAALRIDSSAEFEKAITPGGRDVFSGRNYVDIPTDGMDAPPSRVNPKPKSSPGMLPKRPQSTIGSGTLEVDLAGVKKDKLVRKRSIQKETKAATQKTSMGIGSWMWGGAAVLLSVVCFVLGSAVVSADVGFRLVAGLMPASTAMLMTAFSSVRPMNGDMAFRWYRPFIRNLSVTLGGILILLTLLGPAGSALSLRESYDWFAAPLGMFGKVLAPVARVICAPFAWWFEFIAEIIPW